MDRVRASETSVYFNETTRRHTPESCHLHTRRRENLNSHVYSLFRSTCAVLRCVIFVERDIEFYFVIPRWAPCTAICGVV
jgi:hypothetical protein